MRRRHRRRQDGLPADPVLVPDLAASLANGAAVRADVVARLLGLRILRLHAEVVLVPATTLRQTQSVDGAATIGTIAQARQLLVESDELLGRAAVARPQLTTSASPSRSSPRRPDGPPRRVRSTAERRASR